MHNGTDIAAPMGAPIYAAKGGRVTMAHFSGGRGNLTQIDHGGGLATGYAHQSRFLVRAGDRVSTGQRIGSIGSTGASTGPHLHFEHYINGKYAAPGRIIPGLMEGGYTMSDGLAKLHKNETVLTAPLSEKLKIGIDNLADTGPQLTIDMRGAIIYGVDDLDAKMEGAVNKALSKKENKIGRKRVIR
jgi:murein DD-endopeptidase MepM/ murein hydrolase activator NlpD